MGESHDKLIETDNPVVETAGMIAVRAELDATFELMQDPEVIVATDRVFRTHPKDYPELIAEAESKRQSNTSE